MSRLGRQLGCLLVCVALLAAPASAALPVVTEANLERDTAAAAAAAAVAAVTDATQSDNVNAIVAMKEKVGNASAIGVRAALDARQAEVRAAVAERAVTREGVGAEEAARRILNRLADEIAAKAADKVVADWKASVAVVHAKSRAAAEKGYAKHRHDLLAKAALGAMAPYHLATMRYQREQEVATHNAMSASAEAQKQIDLVASFSSQAAEFNAAGHLAAAVEKHQQAARALVAAQRLKQAATDFYREAGKLGGQVAYYNGAQAQAGVFATATTVVDPLPAVRSE